jgi:hypothetical protein
MLTVGAAGYTEFVHTYLLLFGRRKRGKCLADTCQDTEGKILFF